MKRFKYNLSVTVQQAILGYVHYVEYSMVMTHYRYGLDKGPNGVATVIVLLIILQQNEFAHIPCTAYYFGGLLTVMLPIHFYSTCGVHTVSINDKKA